MANIPPEGYTKLSGSERQPLPDSRPVGPVDPNETVEVTLYLRAPSTSNLTNTINEQVQHPGKTMSREEYIATQSASSDDVAKVEEFARKHDLTIVETDLVGRRIVIAGTAAAMSAAFATELQMYEHPGGTYRGRTGPVHIPNELDKIVVGVFGLEIVRRLGLICNFLRWHLVLLNRMQQLFPIHHHKLPNYIISQRVPTIMAAANV